MEKHHLLIKEISALETYPVRHPVLRKGRPLEDCHFEGDDLPSTIHLGLFEDENLVGVASLLKNSHPDFDNNTPYQLRGMAILESVQGKGYGKQLLTFGENLLKKQGVDLIWFNAREKAIPFYQNSGYLIIGNSFDIRGIGTHFRMFKKI